MGIVCTNSAEFSVSFTTKATNALTKKVVTLMSIIGEKAVAIARENGNYNDITGNLRSSIGYVVLVNGEVVVNGATKQFGGVKGSGGAGVAKGQAVLQKLQSSYSNGIVLIVVAGMDYAMYVEAVHGRDVLTSSKLQAEELAQKLLSNFGKK